MSDKVSLKRTRASWYAMHARCAGRHSNRAYYLGRGITVCAQWADFDVFLADMGLRPEGTSLDRFPNGAGNYEPGNCRWATRVQQAQNKSDNAHIEYQGTTYCVAEWARITGISQARIRKRLRCGWPPADVLNPAKYFRYSPRRSTTRKETT